MEIDDSEGQLVCQFIRLCTNDQSKSTIDQQTAVGIAQFDYSPALSTDAAIDLAIEQLTISSPQLFIGSSSVRDDVIVTFRVTNRSTASRCSPPGCHLRCLRGRALAVGPERLLLPPLLPGVSAVCQLRLRAPATAPTGWHRVELQLHTPLGGLLPSPAANHPFEVYVAPATSAIEF